MTDPKKPGVDDNEWDAAIDDALADWDKTLLGDDDAQKGPPSQGVMPISSAKPHGPAPKPDVAAPLRFPPSEATLVVAAPAPARESEPKKQTTEASVMAFLDDLDPEKEQTAPMPIPTAASSSKPSRPLYIPSSAPPSRESEARRAAAVVESEKARAASASPRPSENVRPASAALESSPRGPAASDFFDELFEKERETVVTAPAPMAPEAQSPAPASTPHAASNDDAGSESEVSIDVVEGSFVDPEEFRPTIIRIEPNEARSGDETAPSTRRVNADDAARGSEAIRSAPFAPLSSKAMLAANASRGSPPSERAAPPSLLSPLQRDFDPDEETKVNKDAEQVKTPLYAAPAGSSGAVTTEYTRADFDDLPTGLLARPAAPESSATPNAWADERPAHEWLSEETHRALVKRIAWLEAEVRRNEGTESARGLLSLSEMCAISGNLEKAEALAVEARELDPELTLAHVQARAFAQERGDGAAILDAIDAETKTLSGPARAHASLVAAEVLRADGSDDRARERWEAAAKDAPNDVRPVVALIAAALARGDYENEVLREGGGRETNEPLASGGATALRLRGVAREDADLHVTAGADALRHARGALETGDVAAAARALMGLEPLTELARGAAWLAATLGATRPETRMEAAEWLRRLAMSDPGNAHTPRALAACAVQLGDSRFLEVAEAHEEALPPLDRAILRALLDVPIAPGDPLVEQVRAIAGAETLAAALAGIAAATTEADRVAQTARGAGNESSRELFRLGRLLATEAAPSALEEQIKIVARDRPDAVRAVGIELAMRGERFDEVSGALGVWSDADDGDTTNHRDRQLAAAVVAELAGEKPRAAAAYRSAHHADPRAEAAVRAIAEIEGTSSYAIDLAAVADAVGESDRGAILRLEAVTGDEMIEDGARAEALERIHDAAPTIPIAAFLAERVARRIGDVDLVLKWIRERRKNSDDPLEAALDDIRETFLVVDRDLNLAAERALAAHKLRPDDIALRELYERIASVSPHDRAAWREQRALGCSGEARALFFLEAAHEFERIGDMDSFLRTAQAARECGDEGLARLAVERAELETGRTTRLAEELLEKAKTTEDPRERREAFERLAEVDELARHDPSSAILWHRAILETDPLYKPSLRRAEHTLVGEGREAELEPIATGIARSLAASLELVATPRADGECSSHVQLAARLRAAAEGAWDQTRDLVELASSRPEASLWSLRAHNAHARFSKDDAALLHTTTALLKRAARPMEVAALSLRAAEAAGRVDNLEQARDLLENAVKEDPGDIVTWGLLADIRKRSNDMRGAAEACESLARTSGVPAHQLLAWYEAGKVWSDLADDATRAASALEQAAAIDVMHRDVFERLATLYSEIGSHEELARLLEQRLARATDPDERVRLEIDRGRALAEIGDVDAARSAFEAALALVPDNTTALSSLADLSAARGDWAAAEQAWVRLARLVSTPEEQRDVYAKLGELYALHAVNLARAEVALKEVLKRAPDDPPTLERLADVYARQNDPARALEVQSQLLGVAKTPHEKRARILDLAKIYEVTARDARKAEQTLDAARREFPTDLLVLRALVEFYTRHRQGPAVQILLDRAANDARRAFAGGRFSPANFELLATCYELRGKGDAARVTRATLEAFRGERSQIEGAEARACATDLDELLAPEGLTAALRGLLARAGDALDVAAPIDLRALRAVPIAPPNGPPHTPAAVQLANLVAGLANRIGLAPVQIHISTQLGRSCIPAGSAPPTIIVGEALLNAPSEPARVFLLVRALKLVQAHASALVRTPTADLAVLVAAWLHAFNPTWNPEGYNPAALAEAGRRLQPGLPRDLTPDIGIMALEVAGSLASQGATLGAHAITWANRTALLAIGDPSAALDGIAWSLGAKDGAPSAAEPRAAWIGRTLEIRDIVAFGVSDPYAEARARAGLGK